MGKGRWVPSVVAVVLSGCGAFTAVGLGEDDPPEGSSSSSSSSGDVDASGASSSGTASSSASSSGSASSSSSSSSSGTSGAIEAGADAVVLPRRVFVTPGVTLPNFAAGGKDPLDAADVLCKASPGAGASDWIAWISVAGKPARDRLTDGMPWHLGTTSGPIVYDSKAQIAASMPPKVAIDKDATGAPVNLPAGAEYAWTNTTGNGSVSGQDCGAWTLNSGGNGRAGNPKGVNGEWTTFITVTCDKAYHLYCFEK